MEIDSEIESPFLENFHLTYCKTTGKTFSFCDLRKGKVEEGSDWAARRQSTIHHRVLMLTEKVSPNNSVCGRNIFRLCRAPESKHRTMLNAFQCFRSMFCRELFLDVCWTKEESVRGCEGQWIVPTLIYRLVPSSPVNRVAPPKNLFLVAK